MCCLFGIMDYGHKLSRKEKTKILSVLSVACEERGTDATGIAYNSGGSLKVYKRPLPAHLLWFKVYEDTNLVMGHTRMTTQGSERFNQNNHPFSGQAGTTSFALAHNGVLNNDKRLRRQYDLPPTKIEPIPTSLYSSSKHPGSCLFRLWPAWPRSWRVPSPSP